MSKIYADLKRNIEIENYLCEGIIIHSQEFSCYCDETFASQELEGLSLKIKNAHKEVILDIDRIISEDDIDDLLLYLEKVYRMFDYFIFSDMAVFGFFRKKDLLEKLIYDPKTLVASSYELSFFSKMKIKVILANELSFQEIKEICNQEKILLEAFGYHQMFYSKRNLLSLYKEYFALKDEVKNKELYIKEELRNDYYPIFESDYGTFIYTNYLFSAFEELIEIKEQLEAIRINGIFLESDKYQKIITIYHNLLNGSKDCESLFNDLKEVEANISKGFLLNKSVLLKRKENEN